MKQIFSFIKLIVAIALILFVITMPRIFNMVDADEFVVILQMLGFMAGIGFFISWLVLRWKLKNLKSEKLASELEVLKGQVSPHFLFNTLNNLYALVLEKDKRAPDVILKLSDLLRYTIYEGEKERVKLKGELEYIDNYISIQKIRSKEDVTISFESDIKNEDLKISPLLFISIIENAFKHGVATLEKDAFIKIKIVESNQRLELTVTNNYNPDNLSPTKGGGLENLKQRLNLFYPQKNTLDIVNDPNGRFQVVLTIFTT